MTFSASDFKAAILEGIPDELPPFQPRDAQVSHAPKRDVAHALSREEQLLAVRNALRYFPQRHHAVLAQEFWDELQNYGRI